MPTTITTNTGPAPLPPRLRLADDEVLRYCDDVETLKAYYAEAVGQRDAAVKVANAFAQALSTLQTKAESLQDKTDEDSFTAVFEAYAELLALVDNAADEACDNEPVGWDSVEPADFPYTLMAGQ